MPATTRARTTIGQLVYPSMPALNFLRLVADLDAALVGCDAGDLHFSHDREDLAMIDAGSSRVGVALARDIDRSGAAVITVTVGYGPVEGRDIRLARRQTVLARLIADRIAARFAPQEMIWTESDEIASPDLVDRATSELSARRRLLLDARAERARQRRAQPRHFVESVDMPRLLARFDATVDARREGRPDPDGTLVASASRAATVAAAAPRRASAPLRLAAHLIDATIMIVALPVGAAMMVYGLARGADLTTSARALALSGMLVGGLHAVGGTVGLEHIARSLGA